MSVCPALCPLCGSRSFYLPPIGDRWCCRVCAPPTGFVPVSLVWIDEP